jgi:hypothetical protein
MLARASSRLSPALAASALVLAAATPAAAPSALAASEKGRVYAAIVHAIAVSEAVPMSFADVAPPASGGAIVLTTSGKISSSAGFVFRGTPAPGTFDAQGLPNHPASVSCSSGALVTGPGPAMRLSAFTNNAPPVFDGAARLSFAVGATLVVNPNQAPGQYTGTYAVTVNF